MDIYIMMELDNIGRSEREREKEREREREREREGLNRRLAIKT